MDHCEVSASTFDKLAERYRDSYMDLTMYDDAYRTFCRLLTRPHARVLDAACGPGNVSRFLLAQRPDLDLLGIDLAPRMVGLAREAVPTAQFLVHDCRRIADLHRRFDGIVCAFGLPYLTRNEAAAFIDAAADALEREGALYISTMLGTVEDSGVERSTSGYEYYVTYYSEDEVTHWLASCGFSVVETHRLQSPGNAGKSTTDLIVIATRP